jgi:CBS domain-containing protein
VAPDATLPEAARVLDAKGIGSLVVGEDRLDGILTLPAVDVYPYPRRRQRR